MVVCGVSSLGSGSGHRSAVGNGTQALSRTGSWKDPNPGLLETGVGPALWGTPEFLLTSGSSGGSELFLDARRTHVTRLRTLAWSPGASST